MDLDTARMRAFLHVAERGTVAAAAAALGYTAPAVSQQITKLEAQLGIRLFDRVGGRLRVSPAGERLLPIARDTLDLVDRVAAVGDERPRRRHLVIAGFASALTTLVVPWLGSRQARQLTVDVREAEDDDALRDLRLGTVDIALTQDYDGAPVAAHDRLVSTPLIRDRLRLVAPPDRAPSVRLAELAEQGWLVNGSGTRCEAATQEVLRRAGITPRIVGRVADNHALLALVAAGHGATIVPERVIRDAKARVTVARADLGAARTIAAVTRLVFTADLADVVAQLQRVARRRPAHPAAGPTLTP